LLAKNGRGSSSKRTRHINIRYFFVADRVASKEVKIEYCPTGEMVADYFTKPLQGTLFRKFRDFIMNVDPLPTMTSPKDRRSVLEINQEVERDSVLLSQDSGSRMKMREQTEHEWTIVGHRKADRHKLLYKKIQVRREWREWKEEILE
jgi:hypothetical protein